jgi:predicted dehydrogenase
MSRTTRRSFLKKSLAGLAVASWSARSWSQVSGANSDIRLAIAGLNNQGRGLSTAFRALPGVRIVALCDVDTAILDREVAAARTGGHDAKGVVDFRELLPRNDIDAIAIATPNHLHALQSIWAMQAGKDVLHEKPVSHNQWEGRQVLAAAKKFNRIVQVNTQNRSSLAIPEAIAWTRAGNLGKVTAVRGIVYKRRLSIGKTHGPVTPPSTVNYDLFLGPAPAAPMRRTRFHYDWHWQWPTGNGDMVAQGNHQLDVGRRFLGDPGHPAGVTTIGGRWGYDDDGETPNTFLVHYDYPTPFIFEVRGLPTKTDAYSGDAGAALTLGSTGGMAETMDKFCGLNVGNVVHCEGGYLTIPSSNYSLVQAFDPNGKLIREFKGVESHLANFLGAVRSRREADLHGPLLQGHLSTTLVHLANISYRVGREMKPGDIRDQLKTRSVLAEPFERLAPHLAANGIDLGKTPARFGAPLRFDAATEKYAGENSVEANRYHSREYRRPFVVPEIS